MTTALQAVSTDTPERPVTQSPYPDVFDPAAVETLLRRIAALTPDSAPQWGSMSAAAMLAHVNVAYEMVYEPAKHPRPNALLRFVIRLVAKQGVVGPKPYPRSSRTAPAFLIKGPRDFGAERARLEGFVQRVRDEGRAAFEGRESPSFGPLTADEWSVLFGKHLDHHLRQFGV